MRFTLLFILILVCCHPSLAQAPVLKPSIGLGSLPVDNTPICSIPVYQGSFDVSGYSVGDTIPDFTLYTLGGTPQNIASALQSQKPALLISGSYTCPVFRAKVADINAMAAFYGTQISILVIYTVEAHPSPTPSPYSGTLWLTSQNQAAGIIFPQPQTYGQRKAMVDTMNAHLNVNVTVLLDGPCNEWWSHFGPAPNNAYLVDTNGIIRARNGWYNKLPDNMWCSIDSLLGTNSGHCSPVSNNGTFSFSLLEDSTISGVAGNIFTIHGMLNNLSATATATVNIQKAQVNIPSGWQTALCTDVCLSTNVNQTQVILPPGDSQSFTFYFYTDTNPSSGNIQVNFTNPNNGNNKAKQKYFTTTWPLEVDHITSESSVCLLAPNPASGSVNVSFKEGGTTPYTISIHNLQGQVVGSSGVGRGKRNTVMDLSSIKSGIYYVHVKGDRTNEVLRLIVQ